MSRTASVLTALGLTVLCGALVVRASTTPAPIARSAPDSVFSAERALGHDSAMAQRPHPTGSQDNARVRAYVVAQLKALGLEPQLQEATAIGTRYPVYGHVINVLVRVPGRTPGGKAVLIAAHYDGVGASAAAGDDGAGSSALLETLHAIKSGVPLEHDVIALFTDGEESGLLGAAAFVREHPWAKDVEVMLNFEARGTTGRSLMFETGPGNRDVAQVLRTAPDVTAGSLMVTIYRLLPNDTDLSEFSLLGKPALNFAFVDGVERYHTWHDDVAHLDAGSVQHHGVHMLALTRAFGNGPLPRPVTGDAIFFDAPFVGLVVMPEAWGLLIALVGAVLVMVILVRLSRGDAPWTRGVLIGVAGTLVTTVVCALVAPRIGAALDALHAARSWDGNPSWREVYAAAIVLLVLAASASAWAVARRWASAPSLHAGALVVWTLLGMFTAFKLPGTSYLFTIPLLVVALAALADRSAETTRLALVARWIAMAVACALLVSVIYSTGGYTLPLNGPGGTAVGALVPLLAWLLAPALETLGGERRWESPGVLLAASLVTFIVGLTTVRRSSDSPFTANLTYVMQYGSDSAWLTAPLSVRRNSYFVPGIFDDATRTLPPMSQADSGMRWLYNATGSTQGMVVKSEMQQLPAGKIFMPDAEVLSDSVSGDQRRVAVRFRTLPMPPQDMSPATVPGALLYVVTGPKFARVIAVDGRAVDTTRYRRAPRTLSVPFVAPPDSGFVVTLELPRDSSLTLRLASMTAGTPRLPALGTTLPPDVILGAERPVDIVPIQNGDVTVRYREVELVKRK